MPIKTIKHKGLKRFWEKGDTSKLPPKDIKTIRRRMDFLDKAQSVDDLKANPALKFHKLIGVDKGQNAIWVSANYRLTFEWRDGDVYVLDFRDYH